jgi:hypothetical protein
MSQTTATTALDHAPEWWTSCMHDQTRARTKRMKKSMMRHSTLFTRKTQAHVFKSFNTKHPTMAPRLLFEPSMHKS